MADHSKVAAPATAGFIQLVQQALLGSTNGRAFSGLILAIIAYLIYAKNKKTSSDSLRVGEKRGDKKVREGLFRKAAGDRWTASSSNASRHW
jgi:hypothetical protein